MNRNFLLILFVFILNGVACSQIYVEYGTLMKNQFPFARLLFKVRGFQRRYIQNTKKIYPSGGFGNSSKFWVQELPTKPLLIIAVSILKEVGALFDENLEDEEIFKLAIEHTNILERGHLPRLQPITKILDSGGPFQALQSACAFLKQETLGIFGPRDPNNINSVQALCDTKEIPHLVTRWVYEPLPQSTVTNFYPHPPILSKAYFDIVIALQWKSLMILYEDDESFLRVSDLIRMAKEKGIIVSVKQLDFVESIGSNRITRNYRKALKAALHSGQKRFVIDCSINILEEILLQAQQVGLITQQYSYFITNLDLHTINLIPFQYSGANVTAIRLIRANNELVTEKINEFNSKSGQEVLTTETLKTETALMIDAVGMFAKALKELPNIHKFASSLVGCNTTESFIFGTTLMNFLKGGEYPGLTGTIKFDNQGFRSDFDLDILELTEGGTEKIGTWNSSKGIRAKHHNYDIIDDDEESLRNKTFVVITCLTDPYAMLKETSNLLYGNDRFEGYGIDLIAELSAMEGFNYTFILRADKSNGVRNPKTGKWSGMIGDINDHIADLAITDLTITSERAEAVDFTAPFMSLGIQILFRRPEEAPPSFFSFADPFAIDTWCGLALAFFLVSISLFIVGRLSPDEWTNPYPCIEEPEFLVNQFSFQNSVWFVVGSLMQQGTELAPMGISVRMVGGMWWFFVLIMVSSYTANLAAFLTTANDIELFKDVNTLVANAERYDIRYGAKVGGATAAFFRDSSNELYRTIYKHMEEHPEDMVKENKDGVALAENTTYAFFMESTSIQYEKERHCKLKEYGDPLDEKFYGIAMRKGAPYRNRLHTAMLKLQSAGTLDALKRKWWTEKRGGGLCDGVTVEAAAGLNLESIEGVFYVTIVGLIISILCVILEMFIATTKISHKMKIPFKQALKLEMKSYLKFESNVKPTVRAKSGSGSPKGSETESTDQIKPRPYGFITAASDELLTKE